MVVVLMVLSTSAKQYYRRESSFAPKQLDFCELAEVSTEVVCVCVWIQVRLTFSLCKVAERRQEKEQSKVHFPSSR